jgi:hypothetical protein
VPYNKWRTRGVDVRIRDVSQRAEIERAAEEQYRHPRIPEPVHRTPADAARVEATRRLLLTDALVTDASETRRLPADVVADITLGQIRREYGRTVMPVTVVNNSAKRSDYDIGIAADAPDGSPIDHSWVWVSKLEPGQMTQQDANFFKDLPAAATFKLLKVKRTRSNDFKKLVTEGREDVETADLWRTCLHEAAHCVVACIHGATVLWS